MYFLEMVLHAHVCAYDEQAHTHTKSGFPEKKVLGTAVADDATCTGVHAVNKAALVRMAAQNLVLQLESALWQGNPQTRL